MECFYTDSCLSQRNIFAHYISSSFIYLCLWLSATAGQVNLYLRRLKKANRGHHTTQYLSIILTTLQITTIWSMQLRTAHNKQTKATNNKLGSLRPSGTGSLCTLAPKRSREVAWWLRSCWGPWGMNTGFNNFVENFVTEGQNKSFDRPFGCLQKTHKN